MPRTKEEIPFQQRLYTRDVVFWKEVDGTLYRFKLAPKEVGSIQWCESDNGVIVDRGRGSVPVEVEPVSDLELLFLYS
jgi:hypothetical protein